MTFSLETLIMVGAIFLCIGGLVGAIISRTLLPPEKQKSLEDSLQASRSELDQYQQDVARHFAETSQLVTNLTSAYKEVHDHLSKGAIQLTNAEISRKILEAGDSALGIEAKDSVDEIQFEAPKDWAPKNPGETGMLSEEFGLKDHHEDESIESLTATQKL